MHVETDLKVLYFGTPVVLIGTRNADGTGNIAPMSSAWWLGQRAMIGMGNASQTTQNLRRTGECVLNLAAPELAEAVDRIALVTGSREFPETKAQRGYSFEPDKFARSGLTELDAETVDAPRVAQSPIHLETRVIEGRPFGETATAWEVEVQRCHVDEDLLIPGTAYVDPDRWDPLIMKFCEFLQRRDTHPVLAPRSGLEDAARLPSDAVTRSPPSGWGQRETPPTRVGQGCLNAHALNFVSAREHAR